jgi:hypothetical protein
MITGIECSVAISLIIKDYRVLEIFIEMKTEN